MMRLLRRRSRLFHWVVAAFLGLALGGVIFLADLAILHNSRLILPNPSGPYRIGRSAWDWVVAGRADPLAGVGSPPRELVVWVWYPARIPASKDAAPSPAAYLPASWVQVRAQSQGASVWLEHAFEKIQTHSLEDEPLVLHPTAFPILIMEPGMGPIIPDYTVFAENLASHGYVVVGINPTGTANETVFLDGRVSPRTVKGSIPESDSPATMQADGSRILAVWVEDVAFVVDQLAGVNKDPASGFYQRLDLDRLGVWGHSFGGATAMAFCQQDARCKAGANLDGSPWGSTAQTSLPRPFLILSEDTHGGCDANCALMRQVYQHTQAGAAYFLSIHGAGHFNFSDLPLRQAPIVRPFFELAGYEGSIAPERALEITNAYLTAFFDQYLKDTPQDILQGQSAAYPEVRFEKR